MEPSWSDHRQDAGIILANVIDCSDPFEHGCRLNVLLNTARKNAFQMEGDVPVSSSSLGSIPIISLGDYLDHKLLSLGFLGCQLKLGLCTLQIIN